MRCSELPEALQGQGESLGVPASVCGDTEQQPGTRGCDIVMVCFDPRIWPCTITFNIVSRTFFSYEILIEEMCFRICVQSETSQMSREKLCGTQEQCTPCVASVELRAVVCPPCRVPWRTKHLVSQPQWPKRSQARVLRPRKQIAWRFV